MNLTFRTVVIGEQFELNGNRYTKQSTMTARMMNTGRVFYIGRYEVCAVLIKET